MFRFGKRDRRRYPIKRDESGLSARARCFASFNEGNRPAEVYKDIGINLKTACTYFQQWKKLPRNFDERYRSIKNALKRRPGVRNRIIESIAQETGETKKRIQKQLESPWGIRQLVSGKYKQILRQKKEKVNHERLEAALNIVRIYEDLGVPLKEIKKALDDLYEKRKSKSKRRNTR